MSENDVNPDTLASFDSVTTSVNSQKPEGYLSSDLTNLEDGKQLRVLIYIVLALLPCLFLIPFMMTRDFVPPTDPSAYQ
jgi:hypothetical protein